MRCGRTAESCGEGAAARCAEPAWRPCHGDRWAKVCEEYLFSFASPDYLAAVSEFERVTRISGVCRDGAVAQLLTEESAASVKNGVATDVEGA